MDKPYLSPSSRRIEDITIEPLDANATWDYSITLNNAGYIYLNTDDAADLALKIVTALFDGPAHKSEAINKIAYLASIMANDDAEAARAAAYEAGE